MEIQRWQREKKIDGAYFFVGYVNTYLGDFFFDDFFFLGDFFLGDFLAGDFCFLYTEAANFM